MNFGPLGNGVSDPFYVNNKGFSYENGEKEKAKYKNNSLG